MSVHYRTEWMSSLQMYQNQDSNSCSHLLLSIYRTGFLLALTSLSVFRRLGWLGQLQGSCADRVPLLREGGHLAWLGSCVVMLRPYHCQVPTVLELTLRWILKTIQIDLSFWKVFRVKREETMKCLQFSPPLPEIRCMQSSLAPSHYRQWVLQGQD